MCNAVEEGGLLYDALMCENNIPSSHIISSPSELPYSRPSLASNLPSLSPSKRYIGPKSIKSKGSKSNIRVKRSKNPNTGKGGGKGSRYGETKSKTAKMIYRKSPKSFKSKGFKSNTSVKSLKVIKRSKSKRSKRSK